MLPQRELTPLERKILARLDREVKVGPFVKKTIRNLADPEDGDTTLMSLMALDEQEDFQTLSHTAYLRKYIDRYASMPPRRRTGNFHFPVDNETQVSDYIISIRTEDSLITVVVTERNGEYGTPNAHFTLLPEARTPSVGDSIKGLLECNSGESALMIFDRLPFRFQR